MLPKSFLYCATVLWYAFTSATLSARSITIINKTNSSFSVDTNGRVWNLVNPFAEVLFIGKGERVRVEIPDGQGMTTFYFVRNWESDKEAKCIESFLAVLAEAAAAYQIVGDVMKKVTPMPQPLHQAIQLTLLCGLYSKQISSFLGLDRLASVSFKAEEGQPMICIEPIEQSFSVFKQDRVTPYVSVSS